MAGDSSVLDRFQNVVAAAGEAFGSDYRYAEEMARQAMALREKEQARQQRRTEGRTPLGV